MSRTRTPIALMIPPVRPWHTTLQAGHSSPPLRIQPALSVLSPRINREPRVLHAPQTDLPPEHPPPRLGIRIVIPGRLIPEVAILKRNEMGSDAGGVKSRESDPARKKLRRVERKSGNPSPMLVACNLGEPPPLGGRAAPSRPERALGQQRLGGSGRAEREGVEKARVYFSTGLSCGAGFRTASGFHTRSFHGLLAANRGPWIDRGTR